jgi:hypothetical protein
LTEIPNTRYKDSIKNILFSKQLVANHIGAFEFRLCNVDQMQSGEATQECLDGLLLEEAGTGKTFILNPNENENEGGNPSVFFKLRIPNGYVCNHCVIQVRGEF